jgi:hypothetical protein
MATKPGQTISKIAIPKIRPASWKVYVQGKAEARYGGRVLGEAGLDTTEPEEEPGLTDPPLYAIVAAPKAGSPLTEEELVTILERDDKLELIFNSS